MSLDTFVVAVNTVQSIKTDISNIVERTTTVYEPIISATQGPPGGQGPQGPQGLQGIQGIQGVQGVIGASLLSGLLDVNVTSLPDGAILVYSLDSGLWDATIELNKQKFDSGQY